MYKYANISAMQQRCANIESKMVHDGNISDFWRTGIEVYVGSFPDVSGCDFHIDPHDKKGIEIFKAFARQMAEHYKSLSNGQ